MTRYAAFLRGVNVGGRKVLKDDLLRCFTDLGFTEVTTFLQSGNVVFESALDDVGVLRRRIEAGLAQQFGMPVITFVYPLSEIKTLIEQYPFERHEDYHAYAVLTDGQIKEMLDDWPADNGTDKVALSALGFYWSVPKGLTLDSPFAKYISPKKVAEHTTTRNLNTLEKMVGSLPL